AQGRVLAVIDRRMDARVKEERQVDPRPDEDDEAVERDLAEEERPVVGEDVAQELLHHRRPPGAAVEVADEPVDHPCCTPHQEGPTGPDIGPVARRWPWSSIASGSCGRGRPAGPKRTVPPVAGSNVE